MPDGVNSLGSSRGCVPFGIEVLNKVGKPLIIDDPTKYPDDVVAWRSKELRVVHETLKFLKEFLGPGRFSLYISGTTRFQRVIRIPASVLANSRYDQLTTRLEGATTSAIYLTDRAFAAGKEISVPVILHELFHAYAQNTTGKDRFPTDLKYAEVVGWKIDYCVGCSNLAKASDAIRRGAGLSPLGDIKSQAPLDKNGQFTGFDGNTGYPVSGYNEDFAETSTRFALQYMANKLGDGVTPNPLAIYVLAYDPNKGNPLISKLGDGGLRERYLRSLYGK